MLNSNITISESTPIAMLTLGQLCEALNELQSANIKRDEQTTGGKRYVYGIRGIRELFNVSHATAQKYKDGFLQPAVYQTGRKIIVDADKAMELFKAGRAAL